MTIVAGAKKHFEYIVVGAGSAGCVLANRLTEDGAARVLLIEAGGRDTHPYIHIPLGLGAMHKRRMFDWGYDSEPEPALNGRRIEAMRGRVLGGSSSINVMAFTRGDPNDYNRWSRNGAPGWAYADVLPFFRRVETWQGGENQWRGGTGPIGVEWSKTDDPLFLAWIEAAKAAGYNLVEDYNAATHEGWGRSQYSIREGKRSSAATAYLRPALKRPNLTLVTDALTTRVTMQDTRATGVEYVQNGQTNHALASSEVILCAGAFNTPQILMLSGIGPAAHLKEMGIAPVLDLPVGRNLQDHPAALIMYARQGGGPFRDAMRADRMALAMARAHLFGSGPATVVPGGLHAFIKTHPELEVPDIEFMFRGAPPHAHLWLPPFKPAYTDGFGIRPTLLHPQSRGEVRLASADPRAKPRIFLNVFSEASDLETLREGFKRAREVAAQKPLDPYRGTETSPGEKVSTDAEIDAWLKKIVVTAHHPASSCAMGTSAQCVLDPQLRVKGAQRLRVVDASAMPDLVSAHINATVLMMAERAAELIWTRSRPLDATR
jgi:4-pyridoxate dehydrogenase